MKNLHKISKKAIFYLPFGDVLKAEGGKMERSREELKNEAEIMKFRNRVLYTLQYTKRINLL